MLINTFPRTGDVLTFIFNKTLDVAFPRAWKLARVTAESTLNHFVFIAVAPLHVPGQGGATPVAKWIKLDQGYCCALQKSRPLNNPGN